MKLPTISEQTKKLVKFEAKLLLGVGLLSVVLYFGLLSAIYHAADYVTEAYTAGFTSNLTK